MYKFILDLANNHQGDLEHGKNILDEVSKLKLPRNSEIIIKFQYRQLETFVYKNANPEQNKRISRFQSTRLTNADYLELRRHAKNLGFSTACTPFDNESVSVIKEHGFEYMKVASCSVQDWPLLEEVAKAKMPTIVSTGGAEIFEIDRVVSFFAHKEIDISLMHCVSIYPTPASLCNLGNITKLLKRYQLPVGWSTHEDQDETLPIAISLALGATLFERHIGIANDKHSLNAYSSTPEQLQSWFDAFELALDCLGDTERTIQSIETESLNSLNRGVFVKKDINSGDEIKNSDVYFAFPLQEGGITAGEFLEGKASKMLKKDIAVKPNDYIVHPKSEILVLKHAIHEIKGMLNEADVRLPSEFTVEFSHHEGVEKFREIGTTLLNIVNEDYCKKLIVCLPKQFHPIHEHSGKTESFTVLYGQVNVLLDGVNYQLNKGDRLDIGLNQKHSFISESGAIIEELSTRDIGDSKYEDLKINKLLRSERKTIVENWGRGILRV